MEIYLLFDKEFKIIKLKKLSELQENIGNNAIRKMIHEKKWEYKQRDIIIKKNQREICSWRV